MFKLIFVEKYHEKTCRNLISFAGNCGGDRLSVTFLTWNRMSPRWVVSGVYS